MKVDLHIHTIYSGHSLLRISHIVKVARKRGLDAVAITDHNEIRGALELSKEFPIILGEEVSSDQGDIIGLFLNEKIERAPALEVMDRIREQGGLVLIPHPFDTLRGESLKSEDLSRMGDIIEVFNSRVVRPRDNERAKKFAESNELPQSVGSDAHTSIEIGRAWMELESIDDPRSFLKALSNTKTHERRSPLIVHAQTKLLKLREVFR